MMITILKKIILITLAVGTPFLNAFCFFDSSGSSWDNIVFIFVSIFFIVFVIPFLAFISIFLPKNRILDKGEALSCLFLSFVMWTGFIVLSITKDDNSLKPQNETISFLREHKFDTGKYPDKLDLADGEKYYTEDGGQNFVFIKNVDDTMYRYCSRPDSPTCKDVPQGSRINYSFIDGWQRIEYCD